MKENVDGMKWKAKPNRIIYYHFLVVLGCSWLGLFLLSACGDQPGLTLPSPAPTAKPVSPVVTVPATPLPRPDMKKIQDQLQAAWTNYSFRFIQPDGRTQDPVENDITTSEGQSYALLRAVWEGDRPKFDKSLEWTVNNLQKRPGDKLFAYKWGKANDGSLKILDPSVASDADSDISLALLFASKRWNEPKYSLMALEILGDLWRKTVVMVGGKPYLTAGDWAPVQARPSLNPSYLAPYAYRIFAKADTAHNWQALVETSYAVIKGCSEANLGGFTSAKLPPNWCAIDPATGQFSLPMEYPKMNLDYGYDAFRVYWRVALDYKWFGEKEALDYLTWSDTLRIKWKKDGKLVNTYDHAGKALSDQEALSNYAGALANFLFTEPSLADSLVLEKYIPAYTTSADDQGRASSGEFRGWGSSQDYYNQNWVWFALALYSGQLANLAA